MIDNSDNRITLSSPVTTTSYALHTLADNLDHAGITVSLAEVRLRQELAGSQYRINQERLQEFINTRHFPDDIRVAETLKFASAKLRERNEDLDPHIAELVSDNFESLIWK